MATKWEIAEVNKVVSREWQSASESPTGKRRVLPNSTKTQVVKLEYPVIDPLSVTTPSDLVGAIDSILATKKMGFETLRGLVEHINFGLYNDVARIIRAGQDLRYTQSQRNAIKQLGGLVEAGILERDVAVSALHRQGVTDAEAAIDAFLTLGDEDDEPKAQPSGK